MMRVVITGGRDYSMTAEDFAWLDCQLTALPINRLVVGCDHPGQKLDTLDIRGADQYAWLWAVTRAKMVPTVGFPADWARYGGPVKGNPAGHIRNAKMASYAACEGDDGPRAPWACLSFPGGNGTLGMMREAFRLGGRIIPCPNEPWWPPRVAELIAELVAKRDKKAARLMARGLLV